MADNRPLTTLGARLRHMRLKSKLTQDALAAAADTNQAVIQKIENGRSLRPRKHLEISHAVGANPAWLMFGDEYAPQLSDEAIHIAKCWDAMTEKERSVLLPFFTSNVNRAKRSPSNHAEKRSANPSSPGMSS